MMSTLPKLLSVVSTTNSSGTARLAIGNVSATVSVGQVAFSCWQLLAFLHGADKGTRVVLERRFARWSSLLFLTASSADDFANAKTPPVLIRTGIGDISTIQQPNYNFTDPCYFTRATLHPRDYLGEHLLNTSSFAEPTFVDAGPCPNYVIVETCSSL